MDLTSPLSTVLHTTTAHVLALEEMGIRTVEQMILFLPRSHEDLSQIHTIEQAVLNEKTTVRGTISRIELVRLRAGKRLVKALLTDSDGASLEVTWFNQPHIMRMLKEDDEVVLTGKIVEDGYALKMKSPTFEKAGSKPLVHAGRLVPLYPQHAIINTKWLREKMALVRPLMKNLPETLPKEILAEEKLMTRTEAIETLHFPDKPEDVEKALERIAFEELYNMQMDALHRRQEWQRVRQERLKIPMNVELIKVFFASLKFTPTASQKIAIYEILKDMEKDVAMSRLLEGDVGSGKTLVATAVMANVLSTGGQCAFMVPTEVLARQHCETVGRTLIGLHNFLQERKRAGEPVPAYRMPRVALLTGSLTQGEADAVRHDIALGTVDVLIGTHALIQDSVSFHDLKLVIVDEQHRFGVEQRTKLTEKGNPHFLAMTATPIPRTLALTAYGHHDLSVLLEKPGNRKVIHTKVTSPLDRITVEHFVDHEIGEGRQVFVICPLIGESKDPEMLEIKSVESEEKRLKQSFPRRRIIALHGQMVPKDKERIMREFKDRKFDILVSTSVIEVGIDIPNATIILIEGAERFGLAQLHQFRGRVGRSDFQSHCFLFTTTPEQSHSQRLKAMEKHNNGFILAEIDLKIRGPGELFGLRQSGFSGPMLSKFFQPEFVIRVRKAAEKVMGEG
ncbi:MAG: ATP-dependent DNA helicase RecG [Candidatus Peregrinibacteria bacterium]